MLTQSDANANAGAEAEERVFKAFLRACFPGWYAIAAIWAAFLFLEIPWAFGFVKLCTWAWVGAHLAFRWKQVLAFVLSVRDKFGAAAKAMADVLGPWIANLNASYHANRIAKDEAKAKPLMMGLAVVRDAPAASPPPVKPIDWLAGAKNVLAFLWGWRKLIAIALVLWFLFGVFAPVYRFAMCPFGGWGPFWCAGSQANLEARVENAETNQAVAEHETDVANRSAELAEETHRDAARVADVVAEAKQEIEDAAVQVDFDELSARYRCGYLRVFNYSCEGEPDPAEIGPGVLHGADASPV